MSAKRRKRATSPDTLEDNWTRLLIGDCRKRLAEIKSGSVQCCVTSPPYWGLRDYKATGQVGLERTTDAYVEALVEVFREVRRCLRRDGTLWLNLGDAYAGSYGAHSRQKTTEANDARSTLEGSSRKAARQIADAPEISTSATKAGTGLRQKNLLGLPWRVAFALQASGWVLRSEIIWEKANAHPESVTDRPTKAHEHVFLFSKQRHYFYDSTAIAEPALVGHRGSFAPTSGTRPRVDHEMRNARSVWSIATEPNHFHCTAMMPRKLAERCVLAGSSHGSLVLDPFAGAGTTLLVARELGRHGVGIELNRESAADAWERTRQCPLFGDLPQGSFEAAAEQSALASQSQLPNAP
ncbi:MAG: DNA-methyltransferase [Polyangiales bacterium]